MGKPRPYTNQTLENLAHNLKFNPPDEGKVDPFYIRQMLDQTGLQVTNTTATHIARELHAKGVVDDWEFGNSEAGTPSGYKYPGPKARRI